MISKKTVLITGGYGFLGRAVARMMHGKGHRVVGLGRGRWDTDQALKHCFDEWLDASITLSSLMTLQDDFDLIVHCGGNGSVGYSLDHPLQDFEKTVRGSIELLEYMRVTKSKARLVYPSSAGIYGVMPDAPISVQDAGNPISPYGYHKGIVEQLLESYSRSYGISIGIVRFFSIYGPGLTKQLLWDAGSKLRSAGEGVAMFWGTGEETRDWIHMDDAASLIEAVANADSKYLIVNGANGERITVRHSLELLKSALRSPAVIEFNGVVRQGDPRFYHADISEARNLGWKPMISLKQGMTAYADWLNKFGE